MKNMALELWLNGQDPKMDSDVKCIVMITFVLDDNGDHQKCSKCKTMNPVISIRINKVMIEYNPAGFFTEQIEDRVKNVINKIQKKLKPNCMGTNCYVIFYNDFSSLVHKRGHRILDKI